MANLTRCLSISASPFRPMAHDDLQDGMVLLDACCLINLFASNRIEDVLSCLPARFYVTEAVMRETLFILTESDPKVGRDNATTEREAIRLQPLIAAGLLEIVRPESEEEVAAYIDFATDLDDGGAMTCALGARRNCDVATDERKANRILDQRAPHVMVHSTASLIKGWADITQMNRQVVRRTLESIQVRGRFRPGSKEPHLPWWESMLHED